MFPAGTGDENYVGSAAETIEGVRLIKEALPNAKTVLGISNVSFGLPAAGREVFNSVFLYHCTLAGLDLAIVNSELMQRYATIPEAERQLAEDLIWYRGDDPVAAFAAHFRDRAPRATAEERLALPLGRPPGPVHHRRQQRGAGRRPGPGAAGTRPPGHHQRPPDGRYGRSGASV